MIERPTAATRLKKAVRRLEETLGKTREPTLRLRARWEGAWKTPGQAKSLAEKEGWARMQAPLKREECQCCLEEVMWN